MKNALTFDIEEWYHICGVGKFYHSLSWEKLESRVETSTLKLLQLLERYSVKATFFILGYIAEKHPALIKEIVSQGHEIATHGYWHRRVYTLSPRSFRKELRASIKILQSLTGKAPLGYRAPEWSIRSEDHWSLNIIKEEGLKYDSSINPIRIIGNPSISRQPHLLKNGLVEFPPATLRLGKENLPISGGLFIRALPLKLIKSGIRKINKDRSPAVLFFHPWEIDPAHPRVKLPFYKYFIHYWNLSKVEEKLQALLEEFEFQPLVKFL